MKKTILLILTLFCLTQAAFSEPQNVLIILDCSYSMDDEINGVKKIDIARQQINNVLKELPNDVNLGLRVYGHKTSFLGINDCKETELLVPVTSNTRNSISSCMKNLCAVGWTPITYSMEQAVANDFVGISGQKRIILVSDGMETCGGSPCEFAVDLMKREKDFTIDVIGFDIASEPEAISQLKCVALATHGKFYTANNSSEFTESLKNSLRIKTKVQGEILSK